MHWVSFCVISRRFEAYMGPHVFLSFRSRSVLAKSSTAERKWAHVWFAGSLHNTLEPPQNCRQCQGCHQDGGATVVFDGPTASDQHLFTVCLLVAAGLIWQHLVAVAAARLPGLFPLPVAPGHTVPGRLLVGVGVFGSAGRGCRWGGGTRAGIGRHYNRVWKEILTKW